MSGIRESIIQKIRNANLSTTEVADCMNKSGAIEGLLPLHTESTCVGEVWWSYAYNESNWELHEQIQNIPEGSIILTEAFHCGKRAIYGHLVAKYMFQKKRASAAIALGFLRDVNELIKEPWPMWYQGATPIGCFNRRNEVSLDSLLIESRQAYYNGSIIVADYCGVVLIPKSLHTEEFLRKLDWIDQQEQSWYEALENQGLSTYEIVCLRKHKK